jgi:hypothetical protein
MEVITFPSGSELEHGRSLFFLHRFKVYLLRTTYPPPPHPPNGTKDRPPLIGGKSITRAIGRGGLWCTKSNISVRRLCCMCY